MSLQKSHEFFAWKKTPQIMVSSKKLMWFLERHCLKVSPYSLYFSMLRTHFLPCLCNMARKISFWPTRETWKNFWGLKSLRMKILLLKYLNLFWSTDFYHFLVCAIMNIKRMQTSKPLLFLKVFYINIWQASHKSCHGNIERLLGCYPISKAILDPTFQRQFTKLLTFAMILG